MIRSLILVLLALTTIASAVDTEKECPKGNAGALRYTYVDADLALMKGYLGMDGMFPKVIKDFSELILSEWVMPCPDVIARDATDGDRLSPEFIRSIGGLPANYSYGNVIFQTFPGDKDNSRPGERFLAYWEILKDGRMRLLFNRDVEFDAQKLKVIFAAVRQNGGLLRKPVIITQKEK